MKTLTTLFLFILLPLNLLSQSITNTLGASGVFYIKDGSNNFLTLTQSTGQVNILKTLRLEATTNSTSGVIYKSTSRFLHNYGTENTFLGLNSGNFTMTGAYNSAVGNYSLYSNTTGDYNSAFGYHSLYANTTGDYNAAFGYYSLLLNTTGDYNSAFGQNALRNNASGNFNSAFGNYSLNANTTGSYNSAFGYNSLIVNTTGIYNTALGYEAGVTVTTGSNLTLIGYSAQPTSGSATNEITLGNSSVSTLRCQQTSITALSDARDKKNITELPLGLDFITKLKPRKFNWDKREWYENNVSDGSKIQEIPTAGFIAQELDEVQISSNAEWLNLVLKENPDKLEATPGNLLPVMVKAIQELNEENDRLKAEIEPLKSMREDFARLEKFVAELKANADNVNEVSLTGSN